MKFRMKKLRGIMVAAIFFPCLSTGVTSDQRMNSLISILESGRPAIGIWTGALTSPRIVKTLATSDVDFIVVDIEHDIYDFGMFHRFLLEVQDFSNRYRTEPRVAPAVLVKLAHRATWDPRYEITESLKFGPSMGIWIPTVEGRADLERAISAVRGAETSALEALDIPLERSDAWPLNPRGELLVAAIIETEEGVRHAQEIVETPGLSALETAHIPDADAERILKMCQRRGVVPAVNATPEDVKAKIDSGYNLIIMGWDLDLLKKGHGIEVSIKSRFKAS